MEIPSIISGPSSAIYAVDVRNKFVIHKIENEHGLVMIKTPRQSRHQEDLQNEAAWVRTVEPELATDTFKLPTIIDEDPEGKWLMYEWIDGEELGEENLAQHIYRMARVSSTISAISLGRMGAPLHYWAKERLERFSSQPALSGLSHQQAHILDALDQDAIALPELTAGMIHGDLKPENILEVGEDWYVTDAEFGTTKERPDWDKPRYHDIAYVYHLLHCQYHRPELAEQFLAEVSGVVAQDEGFDKEFAFSVLERTLSMLSHFVVNRKPNKRVDDKRRLEPQPYLDLISRAVEEIW